MKFSELSPEQKLFTAIFGERLNSIQLKDNTQEAISLIKTWLSQREWRVIELRFGFDNGKAKTLESVSHNFEVTRERIRQIEAKALRKLRYPHGKELKQYII